MTRSFSLTLLVLSIGSSLFSQSYTIDLRPGESTGDDVFFWSYSGSANNGNTETSRFQISEWTRLPERTEQTQLLRFDLSVLPDNAIITSAKLSMYFDPDNTDGRGYGHYGDVPTDFYIQRVAEAWSSESITYNSRPAIDTTGQLLLPGHTEIDQNYEGIDVTDMVSRMAAGENYGFYFQMASDEIYQVIKFASSNHSDFTRRPKLEITFEAENCGIFRIDDGKGKDSRVFDLPAHIDRNFGNDRKLAVQTWTVLGVPTTGRTFMKFDMSTIPTSSAILNAELFLYFDPQNTDARGVHSEDNAFVISPVTENWIEGVITWNNQPGVNESNSLVVPATTDPMMDFLGYDITNLIQSQREEGTDYGFRLALQTEEIYRNVTIAGGEHSVKAYHPKLKVCWESSTDVAEVEVAGQAFYLKAYPNPGNGLITVDFSDVPTGELFYAVTDISGRQMVAFTPVSGRDRQAIDLRGLPSGVYLLTTHLNGMYLATNKLVLRTEITRP